ncbi:unnamed protein product [Rhizophagus irregularis]|nr:unnamed protein product [Rhizophagus irregularis]CAB5294075.1 unnamed protein product [Rhizophagus irregularis]
MMEKEYVDEINSEHERISLKLNELLTSIDDSDTDSTDINSEDFEEAEEEQEVCNEKDEIIDNLEQTRFTPCVIVDFIEGNLLINIAHTGNNEIKKNILIKIFETLLFFLPLKSDSTTSFSTSTANTSTDYKEQEKIVLNEPPSLFMIKTLFIKIYKEKECKNVEINDFNEFGHTFGQKLWNSRLDVNLKKSAIESPQTIQEYYNAFPEFLKIFFSGMIDELYEKKMSICNFQRKKHNKPPKVKISGQTIKIVTFITSMLLSLAFPHLKVWLPQVLASLSRMP